MEITFRLTVLGDPDGQIDLQRLASFAQNFHTATLRSAQAALGIPAYRHALGDEPPPRYRLKRLSEGSTALTVVSVDNREISEEAVTRHLKGLDEYTRTGRWPPHIYPGERQAWAEVYGSLFRTDKNAVALVSVNSGEPRRIDMSTRDELSREPRAPTYEEIDLVGDLHLIEMKFSPRFQIKAEDLDLTFELADQMRAAVDGLRWQRVRAKALWEVGSKRATLTSAPQPTGEPSGIKDRRAIDVPEWLMRERGRIMSFADLHDGWAAGGGHRVRPSTVERANELARRLFEAFPESAAAPTPHFGPNVDGNIEFEWQVGDRFLNGEIMPTGFDLLAMKGDEGVYEGPARQAELFQWVAWLLTGEGAPRS